MTSPILEDDFLDQLLMDAPPAILLLLVPGILMYSSLYAFAKRWKWMSRVLVVPTLALFWISADIAPVRCAALRALLNFAVAIATMRLLDIHALSLTNSFPTYTPQKPSTPPPPPSLMALILLTELRYESFTPNPIRQPPQPTTIPFYPLTPTPRTLQTFYSEPLQLLIHTLLFLTLQSLPQYPPIKALGLLLSIWLIWTSMQLLLRYRTSPPLFGPIYLASSLASFWTEVWHNVFAAPCLSLAYSPTAYVLGRVLRLPKALTRAVAVTAAFALMALFHVFALAPVLSWEGLWRLGVFFVGNGVLTVGEAAVWGRRRHWVRAVVAWVVELAIASWTVRAVDVPDGVFRADWRGLCRGEEKEGWRWGWFGGG